LRTADLNGTVEMEVLEQLSLAVKLFPKLYSQGKAFVEERDDEVHLNRFSQTSS